MPHDDAVYLGHMLDMARKAVAKIQGRPRQAFDRDEDLQIVLAHRVQIIGEAASRVSTSTKEAHPEVPWRRIVGMRHRIVHDYMNIDADILWEVVTRSLPELIALLLPLVPAAKDDTTQ
jgi:uncharacterized protein with HEPN domain